MSDDISEGWKKISDKDFEEDSLKIDENDVDNVIKRMIKEMKNEQEEENISNDAYNRIKEEQRRNKEEGGEFRFVFPESIDNAKKPFDSEKFFWLQYQKSLDNFNHLKIKYNRVISLATASFKMPASSENVWPIASLSEVSLGENERRLTKDIIERFHKFTEQKSMPLVVLSGRPSAGKRTLLNTIASELDLSFDEDYRGEPIENSLHVYLSVEEAWLSKNSKVNSELRYLAVVLAEDIVQQSVLFGPSWRKIDLSRFSLPLIHVRLSSEMYANKMVLRHFVKTLFSRYELSFENEKAAIEKTISRYIRAEGEVMPRPLTAAISTAIKKLRSVKAKGVKHAVDLEEFLGCMPTASYSVRQADVIEPKKSLSDLIVSENVSNSIKSIAKRSLYDSRGRRFQFMDRIKPEAAITCLFFGPPGTGKTAAAEVIAMEAGRELWVAEFSRISGAYVGETEKNLTALFSSAETCGAVLLLDECDAFLGSREKEQNSYRQGIVNHLLMLIQKFEGILVLTTNFADSLDKALERRISYRVAFENPSDSHAAMIMKKALEPDAPLEEGLDFEAMLKGKGLSGGYINVAIELAFDRMTERKGAFISQADLEHGIQQAKKQTDLKKEKIGF